MTTAVVGADGVGVGHERDRRSAAAGRRGARMSCEEHTERHSSWWVAVQALRDIQTGGSERPVEVLRREGLA